MTRFLRLRGQVGYSEAHDLQKALLDARIAGEVPDTVLLLEHSPTITVGRARDAVRNVLEPGDTPVVTVERGGDVTWHGPGQLVAYPIVDLRGRREDLHLHLHSLEAAVIGVLADLGLAPTRDARNTGVWLPGPVLPQKVCSIGIACRRWVTWHGLALNVDPDLSAFARIHPCGFSADVMTRLVDHVPGVTLDALVAPLARHLAIALDIPEGPLETLDVGDVLR
ncbi:MAG: lipoyl(octanoyl) transferase LipB [Myxococcales bacterium]|nr:lipoyl(octanoyl) transferase LipB [Myxococcales bacterium]MCB9669090.1 lipoyl(octanoyl) transferase LipB [Alphaproteobacteria bacterium]